MHSGRPDCMKAGNEILERGPVEKVLGILAQGEGLGLRRV